MQTMQLVFLYLYLMLYACVKRFDVEKKSLADPLSGTPFEI